MPEISWPERAARAQPAAKAGAAAVLSGASCRRRRTRGCGAREAVRAQRGSWKKTYQWLRGLGLRRAEKWPWVAAGLDLARREHARLRDMLGAGRHVEQAPRSPLH